MKKRVLSYQDFVNNKTLEENVSPEEINEGFFDGLLKFFKGLFDLFSDKKVKEESQGISTYLDKVSNSDTKDKDLEEEIDTKRVRKATTDINQAIKKRVEIDIEQKKDKLTAKEIADKYASWLGMVVTQQMSLKLPIIQKMLKNDELSRRFNWVPSKYQKNLQDWYKQKESVFDKELATELMKVAQGPKKDLKNLVEQYTNKYIQFISKKHDAVEKLKNNDQEWLSDLFNGLSASVIGINNAVNSLMKNTDDEKLAKMVAEKIIQERKRKPKAEPEKKEGTEETSKEEETSGESRSRKQEKV